MRSSLHIFDIDHTLINGSSGRHFIITAIKEGVLSSSVLLSLPFVYLRYRLGKLKPAHINRDLPQVKGVDRATLDRVSQLNYENRLEPALYADAVNYIRLLHDSGTELAIASSSVDIIIEPLAQRLGITSIISSSVEFDDKNRCTGRWNDTPIFGEQKRGKVLEFLDKRGIEPAHCSFYSDSIYDLPLLEAIGTPVAINPDLMLARHARKMDWEIKHFG